MNAPQLTEFRADYLDSWIAPEAAQRHDVIARLWDPEATLSTSSPALTLHGMEEISAHVDRVHDDLVASKGLTFRYDQDAASGELLLLRWSMLAPTGDVVGRGLDTIRFTPEGRIASVQMFMGID